MEPPERGGRVGRLLLLGARRAVVVADRLDGAEVLTRSDAPVPVAAELLATAEVVPVPGPKLQGGAGRLLALAAALRSGAVSGRWSPEALERRAWAHAWSGLAARRAAALDVLRLGRPELLGSLGLTATETAWYRACTARDVTELLDRLGDCRYAGSVGLLLARAAELLADGGRAARARALLAPFVAADADAAALDAALSPTPPSDIAARLRELRGRLAGAVLPDDATDAQLHAAGATAERARRAFLRGDGAALAALPGSRDVAHYRALLAAAAGDLRPAPELRPESAAALAAVAGWEGGPPPREVADDPSAWRLVAPRLDALPTAAGPLGDWLAYRRVLRLVFAEDWAGVREAFEEASFGDTPVGRWAADEVINLASFADYQLGGARLSPALRKLTAVVNRNDAPGFAVNAGVVAGELGCMPALGFLTRLAHGARSEVRAGAAARALALWQADEQLTGYPEQLRDLVRQVLAEPVGDDELYRALLARAGSSDPEWLLAGGPVATTPTQRDLLGYLTARARAAQADQPDGDTLRALVAHLTPLARRADAAAWVRREVEWLADELLETVHCPFGEAAALVGGIDDLVRGDVLPLSPALVLAVQAGAHAAVDLGEGSVRPLDAAVERRLLLAPVQRFWAERDRLSAGEAKYVAEELGRCVSVAALFLAQVVADRMARCRDEEPVRGMPEAYRRWRAGVHEPRELVARLRALLGALDGLPLTEPAAELRERQLDSVAGWTAELSGWLAVR